MAKKKASAKKSNVKKVAKKTVSKKTVTKSAKKVSAKEKKPVKAPAKKAAGKKTVTKSKVTATAPAKKATPAKKTAASKPTTKAIVTSRAPKILDLSDFVTPLDDRLIIQTAGTEKITPGGLYIPDTVADVSGNLHGFVVAVGRGHLNKKGHVLPMDVKVGDKVVFTEFSGTKITIQNQDLIILREGDVLGVVSK